MKAYLKPEDEQEHLRMVKSLDMALVLWDIDNWLRAQIKYHEKDYDEVREELYRIMNEYGINLDELIS